MGSSSCSQSRIKFTAKLYRAFTYERGTDPQKDEVHIRNGIDPLRDAGRLGALLLQFPWSFKKHSGGPGAPGQLDRTIQEFLLALHILGRFLSVVRGVGEHDLGPV